MKNRRIVRGAPMDPLRSSSAVKPRCFFKIIISHITPHSTLTIPRRFIAQGYDLADKVFLKAPESSVWVVDLERTTGEAVLRNGWPEFAAYYSISIGHVILFKYEGNSQFHVTILDNSCTEIEYPMSASHNEQANRSGGFRKRKEQALITSKEGRKIKGTGIVKPDTVIPSQAKGASESAIEEGKARALALAKAFKSNKPFFFRRVYPSHVDGTQHGMHVTTAFKEAYENWKDNEQLTLQIAERTWQAECRWTSIGYKIGKGWCKFARDTSLATGDVCVFELVNSSQKLFEVIIYRATVKNENW
ncbi:hypothetical protein DCAR_0729505 [Daucus carota subsp. sativus]|uniref:TF-B3 domain-containing protein n=1 Tax=Daucus carota subsp. sativus TaxID=79200 RepID=A0A161ZML6_DAUCS|nr:hypothetical protein DCAR_0729505 [Daucus carota subsp. sativus]